MAFRIRQPVRHPDVDRAGIVYFPRFYDFFWIAKVVVHVSGPRRSASRSGIWPTG